MKHGKWAVWGFLCLFAVDARSQDSQPVVNDHGRMVYEQSCLACHQADGSGVPSLAPPLIKGIFVGGDKKKLVEIVLNGLQGVEIKGEYYANPMPAFDYLSDEDIASVLTYIRTNFTNKESPVTAEEVEEIRAAR